MAVLGNQITPNKSSNRQEDAQGANVGDYAYGVDGGYYRWDGTGWKSEGGGSNGSSGATAPAFNFDWTKAREEAMAQLTPYYEQKLKDAGGDVERAKKLIEEDYSKGLRYTQEDYSREQGYNTEDMATSLKALGLDVTDETRNARGQLNQRGVLLGEIPAGEDTSKAPTSDYAQNYVLGPMEERQNMRKQAIERAMNRQGELAGVQKTRLEEELTTARKRGIEEQDISFPREQQRLEEEKRQRAFNEVAPQKYTEEITKYRAANSIPS